MVENMDMLVQMKNNFEDLEKMEGLKKRLTGEASKGDFLYDGGRMLTIRTSDELQIFR